MESNVSDYLKHTPRDLRAALCAYAANTKLGETDRMARLIRLTVYHCAKQKGLLKRAA